MLKYRHTFQYHPLKKKKRKERKYIRSVTGCSHSNLFVWLHLICIRCAGSVTPSSWYIEGQCTTWCTVCTVVKYRIYIGQVNVVCCWNIRVTDIQIYQYITLYALIQIQNIGINTTCNSVIYPCPHVSTVTDQNIKLYINERA